MPTVTVPTPPTTLGWLVALAVLIGAVIAALLLGLGVLHALPPLLVVLGIGGVALARLL